MSEKINRISQTQRVVNRHEIILAGFVAREDGEGTYPKALFPQCHVPKRYRKG